MDPAFLSEPARRQLASQIADLTFRLLANCREKEERLAAQFGISVSDFRTLRMFRSQPRLNVKTLIGLTGLSGSRLTRIIDDLEEKKFVTRSVDPNDRRSMVAVLTTKGIAFVRDLEERYVQIHETILDDIPGDKYETLRFGLERMLTSLERWLRESK